MAIRFIHEKDEWANFKWDNGMLLPLLSEAHHSRGRLFGRLESLGFELRDQAVLTTLTSDLVKSSEIEGEILNEDQIRSFIAKRLGIESAGIEIGGSSRYIDGVVEMMLDATQNFRAELTHERLFGWHAALFPSGFSGPYRIETASYRTTPMNVVSGPIGREKIHYTAPEAGRVPSEMEEYIRWFNTENGMDALLKAAIAHIRFVLIHPFSDGNGRIARAITDMQLARSDDSKNRYYSMSTMINAEKKAYYAAIERVTKGDGDLSEWMEWFLGCLNNAIAASDELLDDVFAKASFWKKADAAGLNERQKKMLAKLWDGFRGDLTTLKWAKMMNTSDDTALRDINDLLRKGLLVRSGKGGKGSKYTLRKAQ
ncbi:MAG: Fic family protein [Clostridiales Family XIII bacterium]|jgi:Fic family protein|nr:Fic family protein [Clostridiales Family XIII bacterium]